MAGNREKVDNGSSWLLTVLLPFVQCQKEKGSGKWKSDQPTRAPVSPIPNPCSQDTRRMGRVGSSASLSLPLSPLSHISTFHTAYTMSSFGGDNPPPLPDVTDAQQPPQTSQSGQPTQRTQASQTGTKRKSTQDPYASDVRSHGAPPRELSLEEILNSLYADIQHWERPWSPKDGMQGEEASKTDNERQETNVDFTSAPHTPVSKLGPWGTVACLSCKSRRPLRDLETTRRRVANIWKDALTVINSRDRIWSP